jgi:LysM repeat protein
MGGIGETLKSKAGPLPVWAWTLLGSIALALYLMRKKSQSGTDKAAADQTNSDLGSAAELANMFEVAGLMPYQGGDVYINTTTSQNPPSSPSKPSGGGHDKGGSTGSLPGTANPPGKPPVKGAPKPRATYTVKHGDTLSGIAKKYGTTWQALFKYNTTPGVRPADTERELKKRGPNLLYANEKILIPPKGYK